MRFHWPRGHRPRVIPINGLTCTTIFKVVVSRYGIRVDTRERSYIVCVFGEFSPGCTEIGAPSLLESVPSLMFYRGNLPLFHPPTYVP